VKAGSLEMVKLSIRCGLRPKVRQILLTVEGETPVAAAMLAVDQWVEPSGGAVVVVDSMIVAIVSSPWIRGAPDRGASASVATPNGANLLLHSETVCAESESRRAISTVPTPSSA